METFESPQTGSIYHLPDGQGKDAPAFVCWRQMADGSYRVRVQAKNTEIRDRILEEISARFPGSGWGTGSSGGDDHISVVAGSPTGRDLAIADATAVIAAVVPQDDGHRYA